MPTFACNFNAAIGAGICFFLRKFAASLTMYVHPELPAGKHIYILPLNFVEIITKSFCFYLMFKIELTNVMLIKIEGVWLI